MRALEPSRLWSVGLQAPAFASTVSNGRSHHVFVLRNVTGAIATGLRPKPHHRPYPGPELLNTKRQGRQTASPEGLPGHLPPTRQGGWGNCLSSQNQPAPLRAVHAKLSSRIRASPNKDEVLYDRGPGHNTPQSLLGGRVGAVRRRAEALALRSPPRTGCSALSSSRHCQWHTFHPPHAHHPLCSSEGDTGMGSVRL